MERNRADAEGHRQRRHLGAFRPDQRLDAEQRCRGSQSRETQGAAGPVLGRGDEIPSAAARRLGLDAVHSAAAEHRRGAQRPSPIPNRSSAFLSERRRAFSTRASSITADIDVPADGGSGMLVTQGGRFGGWGFYLLQGQAGLRLRFAGPRAPEGGGNVCIDTWSARTGLHLQARWHRAWQRRDRARSRSTAFEAASGTFPHTIPFALEASETFDVGSDTGTGVDDEDYQTPFAFTGKLNKITIQLEPQG